MRFAALSALVACAADPNIPNQTSMQSVNGRRLTVGFSQDAPGFGFVAEGIGVRDLGAWPLTEDDQGLALRAAAAHCAEFGQGLAPPAGVFYPAEAMWQFGRCVR